MLNREQYLRVAENRPTLRELRNAVTAYENVVRRYPTSGYSDNALWQGANLALLAYERFEDAADLRRGLRLLARLTAGISVQLAERPRSTSSPANSRRRAACSGATSSGRATRCCCLRRRRGGAELVRWMRSPFVISDVRPLPTASCA